MSRERESRELVQAADRLMRALARRAGEGDETAVEGLAELGRLADHRLADAVTLFREFTPAHGAPRYSWTDVARLLGTTRQAAHQRFGGS